MKKMINNPKILDTTVIIPTYNRAQFLKRCLNSIFYGDYLPKEIIVVDNNSQDNTKEVISKINSKFKTSNVKIKLLTELEKGASHSRNKGIEYATSNIIAFLDDDCIVTKKWLEELLKTHKSHPDVACVTGNYYSYKKEDFIENAININSKIGILVNGLNEGYNFSKQYISSFLKKEHYINYFSGQNLSIKKNQIGETRFRTIKGVSCSEDIDFCLCLENMKPLNILYSPKAIVYHNAGHSFWKNIIREIRWGYYNGHIAHTKYQLLLLSLRRHFLYKRIVREELNYYYQSNIKKEFQKAICLAFNISYKIANILGLIESFIFNSEKFEYRKKS